MRSIVLDELLEQEVAMVRDYLDRKAVASGIDDLYWIPLAKELWNDLQIKAHTSEEEGIEAQSFRFAVEVGQDWVRFEMLVRSEGLRNFGGGLADEKQALFLLKFVDDMTKELNLFGRPASN